MFIVITGLDGSGTSTIAKKLHELDCTSQLLKTPSMEYGDRNNIDEKVKIVSPTAHFLYYLSSTVYMSDYIKNHYDYQHNNVYCVRYLIDTVVSNRVAGIEVPFDYNIYGNQLLVPDLTIFITIKESIRQERITVRGKSILDKVLDDDQKRKLFLEQFSLLLPQNSIIIDNSSSDIDDIVNKLYQEISEYDQKKSTKVLSLK